MDFTDLKTFLDKITQWRIPGADCAVYYQNKPVFRYMSGYADMAAQTPISTDNLYNLYSVSKVVTCVAALQLLEKGIYLLNDPVDEYLPEFKQMFIQQENADGQTKLIPARNAIKIQDLFTMSAGLTYNLKTPAIQAVRKATQNRCPTRDIIRAIASEPLVFEPGSHWNYSLCHDVLGALIEVLSGKKFNDYLKENLFQPLGMNSTGFKLTEDRRARMARQYFFNDEKNLAEEISLENAYQIGSEYESGGAGLISSVDDYIRFANALGNGGIAPNGERILSRHTIDLMRTNHLTEALTDFNWIQMAGYGYGLGVRTMIDRAKGGSLSPIGEFGWGGAAGAYVLIDPDNRIAVFYAQHLLNNQEPYVHPRIRNIVYSCLGY